MIWVRFIVGLGLAWKVREALWRGTFRGTWPSNTSSARLWLRYCLTDWADRTIRTNKRRLYVE